MNPVVFHCVLLFCLIILLSVFQSRFKVITHSPWTFILIIILVPFLVYFKVSSKGHNYSWEALTGFEIFGYTLIWSYLNARFFVPKINEGYILAYTLFYWYLLLDTILLKGFNYWMIFFTIISVLPTIIVLRAAFERKVLNRTNKLVIYYWFLFTIIFTFIDQTALDIIVPISVGKQVTVASVLHVFIMSIQLYFISTMLSLLYIGIPIFHMGRGTSWKQAKKECNEIRKYKLDNYVEYQISVVTAICIILVSGLLFYLDYQFNFRNYLILFYTLLFPIVFFYLKLAPRES